MTAAAPGRARLVDLHTHTTASDGSLAPAELVARAAERGLEAVAVTDHDTLAGVPEAMDAASRLGLEVVPGLELSCEWDGVEVHLLGYFVPPEADADPLLARLRAARTTRFAAILDRLDELDVPLDRAQLPPAEVACRPQLARALVAAGHAGSVREAFDRWLGDAAPAYVPKARLAFADGVAFVRRHGGVAVVAHPGAGTAAVEPLLPALARVGVDGVEVHHAGHTHEQAARFLHLCHAYDLAPTGGSDFHGDDGHELGRPPVSADWLEGLRARRPEGASQLRR